MDADTLYSDLPEHLRRYRSDIFDDKYKRLDENGLSRTITAHIAKDGYWYIHPTQPRTLTVSQTANPGVYDRYRFAGPPSAAFRQIGNAVPPALGEQLGQAIRASLDSPVKAMLSSRDTGSALARWFRARTHWQSHGSEARTRWHVIAGEVFADRLVGDTLGRVWSMIQGWEKPVDTVAAAGGLLKVADLMQRRNRAERLLEIARKVADTPEALDNDATLHAVLAGNEAVADLAVLAVQADIDDDDSRSQFSSAVASCGLPHASRASPRWNAGIA